MLNLGKDLLGLLIINVFPSQMTDSVIKVLTENIIKIVRVPLKITNLIQLLDLIVNGSAKAYIK